jgi:hypothetical protein
MTNLPLALVLADAPVIKSNELVTANFDEMTLKESQLLALAVAKISPDLKIEDRPILKIKITRSELNMLFGADSYSSKQLEGVAQLLQSRAITVRQRTGSPVLRDLFDATDLEADPTKNWKRMVIVPTCQYLDGIFYLTLNQDLNEHFLELREQVTSYTLTNLIGMSSFYHVRLYEVLMMQQRGGGEGEITISIVRFKEMLGVADRYPRFTDFRRRVLDPSVVAVSERTNIKVVYSIIVSGKTPVAIKFFIEKKFVEGAPDSPNQLGLEGIDAGLGEIRKELVAIMANAGIDQETALLWAENYKGNADDLRAGIDAADEYIERLMLSGKEVSEAGIYYKAIHEGWRPKRKVVVEKKKQNLKAAPKEPTVDIAAIRGLLARDQGMMDLFIRSLRQDFVSQKILKEEGINAPSLDSAIESFAQRLRKSN